jgi:CheY-like chemotaxis protein
MQQDAHAPIPIIGVSASVESAEGWRAAGMNYLLGKPFSRKDLGRVLRLIDARRAAHPKMKHLALQIQSLEPMHK